VEAICFWSILKKNEEKWKFIYFFVFTFIELKWLNIDEKLIEKLINLYASMRHAKIIIECIKRQRECLNKYWYQFLSSIQINNWTFFGFFGSS